MPQWARCSQGRSSTYGLRGPAGIHPAAPSLPHVISTAAAKEEEEDGREDPLFNCFGLEIAHFLPLHYLWPAWLPGLHLPVREAGSVVTQGWTAGARVSLPCNFCATLQHLAVPYLFSPTLYHCTLW